MCFVVIFGSVTVMFFYKKTRFPKVLFRLRDPSKKLGHVVRISLVQFSASELHEVSSYGHLKVEQVEIRNLRCQHLFSNHVAPYEIMLPSVKLPGGLLGEAI